MLIIHNLIKTNHFYFSEIDEQKNYNENMVKVKHFSWNEVFVKYC